MAATGARRAGARASARLGGPLLPGDAVVVRPGRAPARERGRVRRRPVHEGSFPGGRREDERFGREAFEPLGCRAERRSIERREGGGGGGAEERVCRKEEHLHGEQSPKYGTESPVRGSCGPWRSRVSMGCLWSRSNGGPPHGCEKSGSKSALNRVQGKWKMRGPRVGTLFHLPFPETLPNLQYRATDTS